ncbi:unnamed protein product [Tetraodon nigroviridis]|uniref:WW domain binding protein VOPP1 n=1 Tax=Tetraodon nigroviridis TaxID=99883 RepID=Q4RG03_TETNG|nr:unnamed protein product [Tetraodon nigroviridis]
MWPVLPVRTVRHVQLSSERFCTDPSNMTLLVASGRFILALRALLCVEAKKYCWYFEGGYPVYFICRSYEDCCGTRCCVRALSIHRLWYFWVLLMMAVLFCCGAGFFIRRRIYPSPLRDEPTFNVSFTRHPISPPAPQQPEGLQGFGMNGVAGGEPASPVTHPLYPQDGGLLLSTAVLL